MDQNSKWQAKANIIHLLVIVWFQNGMFQIVEICIQNYKTVHS